MPGNFVRKTRREILHRFGRFPDPGGYMGGLANAFYNVANRRSAAGTRRFTAGRPEKRIIGMRYIFIGEIAVCRDSFAVNQNCRFMRIVPCHVIMQAPRDKGKQNQNEQPRFYQLHFTKIDIFIIPFCQSENYTYRELTGEGNGHKSVFPLFS